MANIAASDVTYTLQENAGFTADARKKATYKIQFGDGSKTYPTGGIPLTTGKLGLTTKIEDFEFIDPGSGDGFLYKYDRVNNKIRIYEVPALDGDAASAQALAELTGGTDAPAATILYARVEGY